MFVRFRQTEARLQASLVRSFRADGKVRHEHIAMLGTVDAPPSVAGRLAFWQHLHERMARLGHRLDDATRERLLGDIRARIPMVTPDEVRAEQLANAQAEARYWEGIADGHGTLIASAERTEAVAPERDKATDPCQGPHHPH